MLLETAACCVEGGLGGEDWTIFYGPEGGLQMIAGGAPNAVAAQGWRVTHTPGRVSVEGRSSDEYCRLETKATAPGVRALVSDLRLYELAA